VKLIVLQYEKFHPEIRDEKTITNDDFKKHLAILKNEGYSSVSCKAIYHSLMKVGKLPDKSVLITFDNGDITQYRNAAPILEEQGFHAVFFVTGKSILSSGCSNYGYGIGCMNIYQLHFLQKIGFEIGIHGYTNMNFKTSSVNDLRKDIVKSILLFERLDMPVTNVLAYPSGTKPIMFWKTRKLYRMLKQEKILLAFAKGNKVNDLSGTHRFNISRFEIRGKETEKTFLTNIREKWV
jgi:peptidoglycan/xylan/chitin deacetylase (PgdA/CDA1 family)